MRVLIVGAAGYVANIVRPALEAAHTCCYFDFRDVPGAGERMINGDVNDQAAVENAVAGFDSIIYLALGVQKGGRISEQYKNVRDIGAAFGVNTQGLYRFLAAGLAAGVTHFIYGDSLSVFQGLNGTKGISDDTPTNAWDPYGMSKRLGEALCEAAGEQYPESTILALRMIHPLNDEHWPDGGCLPERMRRFSQGPNDLGRLFLAALAYRVPGVQFINTTGDLSGELLPNTKASQLLGWKPEGN